MNALKIIRTLLFVRLEVKDEPEGAFLGALNVPGTTVQYLVIEIRIIGLLALLGHVRFH